jgi:superfamily II DNA helicase RecQ
MEQEQTVHCLLEGRDVFAVMPTGFACREVLE